MVVREILFGDAEPSPGLVLRALEILGLDGRATLKGPLKVNGKVTGCLVRFHAEADADTFVAAWNGFLEMKKSGRPAFAFAPSFTMPTMPLRLGGESEIGLPTPSSPAPREGSQ